jgi:tetratricopeptide (TPR) repeat protein
MKKKVGARPGAARLAELLGQAIALHRHGQFDLAAEIYREILVLAPAHFDALQLLGAVELQAGRAAQALALFDRALGVRTDFPDLHANRGLALKVLGRLDEALASLDRAVALNPRHAETRSNRGTVLQELGRNREALDDFDRALQLDPAHAQAMLNRGVVLLALDRRSEALAAIDRALEMRPGLAEAHFNRGNALKALGRDTEALASYRQALDADPRHAKALCNRGVILKTLGHVEEAIAQYTRAIEAASAYADPYFNRALALVQQERCDAALDDYDRAVAIDPERVEFHANRGDALRKLDRLDEALAALDRAVALAPDSVLAHSHRGLVLQALDRHKEALAEFETVLRIAPGRHGEYLNRGNALIGLDRFDEALHSFDAALEDGQLAAEVFYNRGSALHQIGRLEESVASFNQALAYRPTYPEASWNRGLSRLLGGDLPGGWPDYESRWQVLPQKMQVRGFRQPLWSGSEDLQGKVILLHAEQGLGDTIQFSRYATEVARRGACAVLEVQPPLVTLLQDLEGVARVIARGDPLPPFDLHCPLLSLPLAFQTALTDISGQPYLRADPSRIGKWQSYLAERARPRIGIAWSGNPEHRNDHNRSIAFSQFSRLLDRNGSYYCLQREIREGDIPALREHGAVDLLGDRLDDFSDTAALVASMDLVIAVDTSLAHLAGALGKEVWILLPFVPDWRWLTDRTTAPWYDSARLFRQPAHGDWDSVLAAVGKALDERS